MATWDIHLLGAYLEPKAFSLILITTLWGKLPRPFYRIGDWGLEVKDALAIKGWGLVLVIIPLHHHRHECSHSELSPRDTHIFISIPQYLPWFWAGVRDCVYPFFVLISTQLDHGARFTLDAIWESQFHVAPAIHLYSLSPSQSNPHPDQPSLIVFSVPLPRKTISQCVFLMFSFVLVCMIFFGHSLSSILLNPSLIDSTF